MGTLLHVIGLLLLLTAGVASLTSLLLGLPGTLFIVIAALVYGWATGFAAVTWSTVGWLFLLAVVGEGGEFFAGAAGAAGERPSRRVMVGALAGGVVGGLAGTPLLFGVGSLLGALVGAFAGAALAVISEGGTMTSALSTGLAAFRGRLLGFVFKAAIAVVMLVVLAAAVL
ncbi:MAG TPA: DUF456 family protein [Candidatus Binatia bacterium]|jgi:uncharacterized protein